MREMAQLGLRSAFTAGPTRSPTRSRSTRTRRTARTIAEYANRFWRVLVQADRVFDEFPGALHRQVQPGALLLGRAGSRRHALLRTARPPSIPAAFRTCPTGSRARRTRTRSAAAASGRAAGRFPTPRSTPTPIRSRPASPTARGRSRAEAFYSNDLREFILPYDAVREAASPDATLLAFLQSTYEAAASRAQWDRAALERDLASKR